MDKIQVVRKDQEETTKEGITSRQVFETDTDHVGEVRISGGTTGGWHHHGKRTMYGYVISGKANIEFGVDGKEAAVLSQGDYFQIPPGLVHRDVNPNQGEARIIIVNIGPGPGTIQVQGPSTS